MTNAAGGAFGKPSSIKQCPNHAGGHNYVKTGHYEDVWFGWLKDGGLFSRGYDTYECSYCGRTSKKHV